MAGAAPVSRRVARQGRLTLPRPAGDHRLASDLYHFLLVTSWPRLLAVLALAYCAANTLFAAAYLLGGDGIENARPGSFSDAFFFSVQTMATIGALSRCGAPGGGGPALGGPAPGGRRAARAGMI